MRNIWNVSVSAGLAAISLLVLSIANRAGASEEGESVPIVRQWSGAYSAQSTPRREVIRDEQRWRSLWQAMRGRSVPLPDLPEIDFHQHMIIGVFLGTKPSGGFSIHITRIVQNDKLRVTVIESAPGPGDMVTMALTTPYHVVVVPRSEKPIEFVGPQDKKLPRPAPGRPPVSDR